MSSTEEAPPDASRDHAPEHVIWGVDVDPAHTTICHLTEPLAFTFVSVSDDPGPERLGRLADALIVRALAAAERHPPLAIFIEVPMGKFRRPELDHAYGLVAGTLANLFRTWYSEPILVEHANSSRWKQRVLGRGNLTASEAVAGARMLELALKDCSPDEVKAWCVARYGEQITTVLPPADRG